MSTDTLQNDKVLRIERLMEVKGTTGSGSASYRYSLTDLGRERAAVAQDKRPVRRATPDGQARLRDQARATGNE